MKKYLRQLFLFSSSSYAKVPEKENKNRENGEHFFYLSAGQGCKVLTKAMYHIWNFSPFLLWSFLSAQATLSPVVPPQPKKGFKDFPLSLFALFPVLQGRVAPASAGTLNKALVRKSVSVLQVCSILVPSGEPQEWRQMRKERDVVKKMW